MSKQKAKGTTFERMMADYLAETVDDRIDRKVLGGTLDTGDIGGLRVHGQKVVVECKNHREYKFGPWLLEAEKERANDAALAGVVFAKRHGKGRPEDQMVVMTAKDFVALIMGVRE